MTHTGRFFMVGLAAVLLSACTTVMVGRDFDLTRFASRVEQGVTSQAQVRDWLGAPTSKGINMGGDGEKLEEWSYYFGSGEVGGMAQAQVKLLQVKFDKQGRVRSYNWSSSR